MYKYGTVGLTYISVSCLIDRSTHSSAYKTAYTDAYKTRHTIPVYTALSEDEPAGSKHVEDIKN
jgi:hypothetical protein